MWFEIWKLISTSRHEIADRNGAVCKRSFLVSETYLGMRLERGRSRGLGCTYRSGKQATDGLLSDRPEARDGQLRMVVG